jgi:2-polyprenyl-3-methyl-5-hydroxy-6-metoxy-1,4-benzoquinol methylase
MASNKEETIFQREADFHNNWAASATLDSVSVDRYVGSPTALENQFILKRLGNLAGRRVLDIGCGLGESSVMFSLLGAEVTASDLSPEMVRFAEKLAEYHGVKITTAVGAAEEIKVESESFDVVYCANTLHHLVNKQRFVERIQSLLKRGGIFCSWDPVKYNPIINVYRRLATEVRTKDEAPLGMNDLKLLKRYFSRVEHHHFWLLTLALFLKYFAVDHISPNQDRYWKRIYKEEERTLWWWRSLARLDSFLLKLPLIQWLSWNVVLMAWKDDVVAR